MKKVVFILNEEKLKVIKKWVREMKSDENLIPFFKTVNLSLKNVEPKHKLYFVKSEFVRSVQSAIADLDSTCKASRFEEIRYEEVEKYILRERIITQDHFNLINAYNIAIGKFTFEELISA